MRKEIKITPLTQLKDARGKFNTIGVVKFFDNPKGTKGTGYRLFLSVSDPSMNGDKLPCVIFNNCKDKLPQVKALGDVIIMHRLILESYKNRTQGVGYEYTGFAAVVFPGALSDPLVPRPSILRCSFNANDLRTVQQFKYWYNSSDCPLEREVIGFGRGSSSESAVHSSKINDVVKPLHSVCIGEFCSVEGQIVSIYSFPEDKTCVILYIWDGKLVPKNRKVVFASPFRESSSGAIVCRVDPYLAAVTAHGLSDESPNVSDQLAKPSNLSSIRYEKLPLDWSVPVVVYDNHALNVVTNNLEPGNLVRIVNVHVTACGAYCKRAGCVRLVVHGGGSKYGRSIYLLGTERYIKDYADLNARGYVHFPYDLSSDINRFGLIDNLLRGFGDRPPSLSLPKDLSNIQFRSLFTIAQLCAVPTSNRTDIETFDKSLPVESTPATEYSSTYPHSFYARVAARVVNISPLDLATLRDSLLLCCTVCRSSVRHSSLTEIDGKICNCIKDFIIIPFVFLQLEDPTGSMVVGVTGENALDFIEYLSPLEFPLSAGSHERALWWANLVLSLLKCSSASAEHLFKILRQLVGQWIDVIVKLSWRFINDISSDCIEDKIKMKFELSSRNFV